MRLANHSSALKHLMAEGFVDFCPSNLRPYSDWSPQVRLFKKDFLAYAQEDFNGDIKKCFSWCIRSFKCHNCMDKETGLWVHFYNGE